MHHDNIQCHVRWLDYMYSVGVLSILFSQMMMCACVCVLTLCACIQCVYVCVCLHCFDAVVHVALGRVFLECCD